MFWDILHFSGTFSSKENDLNLIFFHLLSLSLHLCRSIWLNLIIANVGIHEVTSQICWEYHIYTAFPCVFIVCFPFCIYCHTLIFCFCFNIDPLPWRYELCTPFLTASFISSDNCSAAFSAKVDESHEPSAEDVSAGLTSSFTVTTCLLSPIVRSSVSTS